MRPTFRRLLTGLAAGAAIGLAVGGVGCAAPAVAASPATLTADGTLVVPDGVCSLEVTATGQGGAAGDFRGANTPGGRAAVVTGTVPVTPGETLTVDVRHGGGRNGANNGAPSPSAGGGLTGLLRGSTELVIAGGGGGGGYRQGTAGGDAGLLGATAESGAGTHGGAGGSPTSGGAAGSVVFQGSFISYDPTDGIRLAGGHGAGNPLNLIGGGGGAGHFGGGGGGIVNSMLTSVGPSDLSAGGGGGSSYVDPSVTSPGSALAATGATPSLAYTTLPCPVAPTATGPDSATVVAGATATFTVVAAGVPAPSIQWQRADGAGWSDLAGENGASYAFTATVADDGARFRAELTNSAGTVDSDVATLTVQSPAIVVTPDSVAAGAAVVVEGSGFLPGDYDVVLHSAPVVLGTATAAADGTFRFRGTVPAGTAAGAHTIEVQLSGGVLASASLTVATAGPSGSDGTSGLAVTGIETAPAAPVAVLAVLVGAALLMSRARRRRSA